MVERPYISKLVKGVVRPSLLSRCQLLLLSHIEEFMIFCQGLIGRT
jgi:hypothetical protein